MVFRLAFLGVVVGMAFSCMPLSAQAPPWETESATPALAEAEPAERDEIETDRDSFTPATSTAGFGETIFEAAHSFIDNRQVPDTHSFPELLIRHGANDWLELRVGWNYEVGGAGSPVSGNVPSDFDDEPELERSSRLLYGMKLWFSRQENWLPQSAVILQGYSPTTGELTHSDFSASYVFGWTLPNRWTWNSAVRYSTGQFEEDDFNVWAPSTVLKIPVGERWKTHVEYFGVFTQGRQDESVQHFFSTGGHYLITSNLEIGCRVGWGLNHDAPDFFSNAGLGWRF
ncbi:MAG: transporter [Pirellulaceae bacterium]